MPPKRKAATGSAKGGKKGKIEQGVEVPVTRQEAGATLEVGDNEIGGKPSHKVDQHCPLSVPIGRVQILYDYDCMLSCLDMERNSHKFYKLQLLQSGESFYFWSRWGRLGEPGANALLGPTTKEKAIECFEKKFKDKTRNPWAWRNTSFQPVPGKYTLVDKLQEEENNDNDATAIAGTTDGKTMLPKKVPQSQLDLHTQYLMKLILDNNMFKETMRKLDIDIDKMPPCQLTRALLAQGFEVLNELELDLEAGRRDRLEELWSQFYTVLPHKYGRLASACIDSLDGVRQKIDMLLVLGDIEVAQGLQKERDKQFAVKGDIPRHPLDISYGLLRCGLKLLPQTSQEFRVIETYTAMTKGDWNMQVKNVWRVDRHGEDFQCMQHDTIGNRLLLWHGTNIATVAAILKSGLRIMPHSDKLERHGICFASESATAANYVQTMGKSGIMFLSEIPLGKQYILEKTGKILKSTPTGYDSVLAQGRCTPDPKQYTQLQFGHLHVQVPQSKPVEFPGSKDSEFDFSKYIIYRQSQQRIRFLVLMDMECKT